MKNTVTALFDEAKVDPTTGGGVTFMAAFLGALEYVLGSDAGRAALKTLSDIVRREALVMSFADVFYLLTFLFLALGCAVPFVRKPRAAAGGGGH